MFPCNKCGRCCRHVTASELDRGDGTCIYLTSDNLCSIYDSRPIYCNIDKFYQLFYSDKMSIEDYYKLNQEVCSQLTETDVVEPCKP